PIKSNFREGMDILEYFIGARGSRKSLSDTALKTADSGYLTRRLVDVSQEVIVREEDCGTTEGLWVGNVTDGTDIIEPMKDRLLGRYTMQDIVDPRTGELIIANGEMIGSEHVKKILDSGLTEVYLRSVRKCKSRHGVCVHCYGSDLATGKPVSIGEAVGIIAAQSIGEPGTQLTMRTFHTGGIAGTNITQGLPRVEELFEARKPKQTAVIAEASGIIRVQDTKRNRTLTLTDEAGNEYVYAIPFSTKMTIADGDYVSRGQALTEGNLSPQDITRVNGIDAAYDYLVREVQKVYRMQSIDINDKHIEVITRQMTRQCKVEDPGDTRLLAGSVVDVNTFEEANDLIRRDIEAGDKTLRTATCSHMLLGITKAALQTESFLSAASFQETTKVLTEAAIRGKVDHLLGLKENVIIGKLIPAGTGMERYRSIRVEKADRVPDEDIIDEA
ncbi:MAG: DNA-directed RNA polymerase subunit beta', partial [Eubacteriales bacterium]